MKISLSLAINARAVGVVPFDPDAQIYFDAVIANSGALSDTEKDGYNVYRIDSKDNANPWNGDCHIDLPMIGGTVESMVINAKNPGTFDAIAVNTVAGDFTANGYEPNGVDSYFRMILIASNILTIQSVGMEYYSRTDLNVNTNEIGAFVSASQYLAIKLRDGGNITSQAYNNTIGQGKLNTTVANSLGGFFITRVASNDHKHFKDGSQVGATNTGSGGSQSNIEFYLGCINSNSTPSAFSTRQCAGSGIYDGLIPAKVLAQYLARQTYNTLLSRNV